MDPEGGFTGNYYRNYSMVPKQSVDLINQSGELTEKEKLRLKNEEKVLLIFILTLVVGQIVLIVWKKLHARSYSLATLLGWWIFPLILSLYQHWWWFIFTWLLFSCKTNMMVRKALQRPIKGTTSRLVYNWFLFIHRLSFVHTIIGCCIMLFERADKPGYSWGNLVYFYGFYYGILGRDISEICADKMARHYSTNKGLAIINQNPSICALCDNKFLGNDNELIENIYKLTCGHVFHEYCIKGWCIVGKRQICPYCKEKFYLGPMFRHFDIFYGLYLDDMRWVLKLLAWLISMIVLLAGGICWMLRSE